MCASCSSSVRQTPQTLQRGSAIGLSTSMQASHVQRSILKDMASDNLQKQRLKWQEDAKMAAIQGIPFKRPSASSCHWSDDLVGTSVYGRENAWFQADPKKSMG